MRPCTLAWAAQLLVAAAGSAAEWSADQIEVTHQPQVIAMGLRRFDLVRRSHPDLKAEMTFLERTGKPIDTFAIDYGHEATPSHVVFSKAPGRDYASVRIVFREAGKKDETLTLMLPPATAPAGRARLTDEVADLTPAVIVT